jgi:hypothetical protein
MPNLIDLPTTGCIAQCSNPRYEDVNATPDQNSLSLTVKVVFNGRAGELEDFITYTRGSTMAVKNAAVRALVNRLLASFEPGVTLTQANIEIIGMPA